MNEVDRILEGCIDMHTHCYPDPYMERREDVLELAYSARQAKMAAVVLKCHQCPTSSLAYMANKIVGDIQLFGSVVLNKAVGGLNPYAVEAEARLGAKVIWMPTVNSVPDMSLKKERGISLIDDNGRLHSEVMDILNIIKEYKIVLATGHISITEIDILCSEAKRMGVKLIITHPLMKSFGTHLSISKQIDLANRGAIIEHTYVVCMPFMGMVQPNMIANAIKSVGVEHCILSSDFGQVFNPPITEGSRMMIAAMLKCGLDRSDLEILVKRNPSTLLDLG